MKFRLNEYGSKNIEKIENLDATNLYDLGKKLLNGDGVERDFRKGKEYLEKSADLGNKKAFDMLGIMYLNALGVEQNLKKSLEYYKKSDSKTQIELTDKLIRDYGENYKYINEINHKNDMYIHLPIEFKNDEKEKNEKLYFQKNLQSDSEINKQDIINKYIAKIDERLDELGSSRRIR